MKKISLLILLLLPYFVQGQGRITKVAGGTSWAGFAGDGGSAIATSACFFRPTGVCTDAAGNIFVCDMMNYRIRKVDATTGILTTIAGNGSSTYSGDGGPATAAGLNTSWSYCTLAADGSGNIYFTDGSNRIRKVNVSTGIISTIAGNGSTSVSGDGGPATAAGIGTPTSVFVDSFGDVYLSGRYNIRKVAVASGIITRVAGGTTSGGYSGDGGPATAAQFNNITSIGVDRVGNVYCADNGNYRIRKINTSGIVTTIAGNGTRLYNGDGGPATAASFDEPESITIDKPGNLFIYERSSGVIRKIATSGIITKVAGCFSSSYGTSTNADSVSISATVIYSDTVGTIYYGNGAGQTYKIEHPSSRIATLSVTDSMASTACAVPATLHFGVSGSVTDTPATTDSVRVTVDFDDFSANPTRTYTLPYTSSGGVYSFGDIFSTIGSYTYNAPGVFRPKVTLRFSRGYEQILYAPQVTVRSICSSGITSLTVDSAQANISSGLCSNPATITHSIWGRVSGTPSTGDSVYIILNNDDHGAPFEIHKVPYTFSGSAYYFHDTISHLYPYGGYHQFVRAVTASGLYSTETYRPLTPNSCSGGSISASFTDTASSALYCSLPFTNRFNISAYLYDSAMLTSPVSIVVNYGDGTITTYTVPTTISGGSTRATLSNFTHVYTMPGLYAPSATITAGTYSRTLTSASFNLGTSCSPLTGVFYVDSNADCVMQPHELRLGYWPYAIINTSLSDTTYGWCNDTGYFAAIVPDGFSYRVIADPSAYFTGTSSATTLTASCPSTGTYSFTSASGSSYLQNFGFTCASPSTMDMYVAGTTTRVRPGDTSYSTVIASNPYGYVCDTLSSTVVFTLDTILNYAGIQSGPTPTSVVGNVITWHIANTGALFEFNAVVKGFCHTTATASDTVDNTLSVTATRITDPDMTNNVISWRVPVRNSYDPNEKSVSPQGFGPAGYIFNGTPLSYVIHFQNTGNDSARNITILDTLDPSLDISTLQLVGNSHSVNLYSYPGNVVAFRFSNIYLCDSATNPAASMGYVAYNIEPFDSLALGTAIRNNAAIYFDYNPAIFTNTTLNTIEDSVGMIYGASFVCIGATVPLTVAGASGTWSSAAGLVSVTSGLVTGIAPGIDTVIFTSYGGQRLYKIVTVIAPPVAGSITGADSVCAGNFVTLSHTATGGSWATSNASVASVSATGLVTGITPGSALISYTQTNACGAATATKLMTVTPAASCSSTGIKVAAGNAAPLKISPNPNNGIFVIDIPGQTGKSVISIIDVYGKVIMEQEALTERPAIDLHNHKGTFIIKVLKNGETYRTKVTVL